MTTQPNRSVQGVLFDLDGTLVDSAPDLASALNNMRIRRGLAPLPLAQLRSFASHGARGLLGAGLNVDETHPEYIALRDEFLHEYEQCATEQTRLFAGVTELLDYLERNQIRWGIVTNKHQRFTTPVVEFLGLAQRAGVIVCGDTTAHAKPHPEPMWYAAQQINCAPERLWYVGDDLRDIQAARAAGFARAIAAGYGYGERARMTEWAADAQIEKALDLVALLENAN